MPARSDGITLVAIATFIVGFDQLTKSAVISVLDPGQANLRLDLFGGLMALEYTENRGAAFGLFEGLTSVLALVSVVIVVALLLHYSRQPQPQVWQTVAVSMITGGALGNLIDRVRLGYVVDFVSVGAWPNFNVADATISIGVFILLWGWLRQEGAWGTTRTVDQKG